MINESFNTTSATSGAETAYPSVAPGFNPPPPGYLVQEYDRFKMVMHYENKMKKPPKKIRSDVGPVPKSNRKIVEDRGKIDTPR